MKGWLYSMKKYKELEKKEPQNKIEVPKIINIKFNSPKNCEELQKNLLSDLRKQAFDL